MGFAAMGSGPDPLRLLSRFASRLASDRPPAVPPPAAHDDGPTAERVGMDAASVSIEVDAEANRATIVVAGAFDFNLHRRFCDAFRSADVGNYLVDLRSTTFLDSAALGALLQVKEHAAQRGGTLEVLPAAGTIAETLKMAHFDQLMTILPPAA